VLHEAGDRHAGRTGSPAEPRWGLPANHDEPYLWNLTHDPRPDIVEKKRTPSSFAAQSIDPVNPTVGGKSRLEGTGWCHSKNSTSTPVGITSASIPYCARKYSASRSDTAMTAVNRRRLSDSNRFILSC